MAMEMNRFTSLCDLATRPISAHLRLLLPPVQRYDVSEKKILWHMYLAPEKVDIGERREWGRLGILVECGY